MHDARVFAHSALYLKLPKGELLPRSKTLTYNGAYVLFDSAYPLETWLMKPFSQAAAVTPRQKT